MATKFGRIEHSGNLFEEQIFHKNQTLTSASDGLNQHYLIKDNYTDSEKATLTTMQ